MLTNELLKDPVFGAIAHLERAGQTVVSPL